MAIDERNKRVIFSGKVLENKGFSNTFFLAFSFRQLLRPINLISL